ncbi:arginine--tRNA ligase [Pedobacter psychrophilus]|uniref:Arginine--tRNA ligase n=1 Tax=Pedobacter psychrophilus TaxID=1826909 RepID=A0A179DM63_9SPHI|nr:arginine--tRNA ligase [Pedobacter psychrophilus]OAQ42141.1 arginine--tRNA ligase [Pedobacter psychrophilus]
MNFLHQAISKAFNEIFDHEVSENQIVLEQTKKEFEGQVTFVVFPFVRFSKKSPEQTATLIGDYLKEYCEEVADFNVIKGFLNIVLSDAYWIDEFLNISHPDFGRLPSNGQKVMVEYSSPNTNKPLHLGHVRNNLLGYAVAEILQAAGFEVIKANLVNDRGIHICKSMLAWQKFGENETPESTHLKGDHLVGKYYVIFDQHYKKEIEFLKAEGKTEEEAKKQAPLILEAQEMLLKWETGDEAVIALWKKMNEWVYAGFDKTYKALGVNFDKYYYESNTYLLGKDIVAEGLEKGVFFKKEDGSVWIDLTADGLDEKLVQRADGTSVYITQDLGTAQLKYNDFKMQESIYVVGNEQDYHFKVLFLILEKLGKSWAKGLYHLSYGMVDLPSGKMKSREGTVVDADDLIEEMKQTAKEKTEALGKVDNFEAAEKEQLFEMIGLGALKYFLLKVEPKKRLLFDPNESIDFQGNTGPFIQYTHARIKSVLAKAEKELGKIIIKKTEALAETELELIQILSKYPNLIKLAAEEHNPASVANYAYELAKIYNKFYQTESILKVEDEDLKIFRLKLSYHTASTLKKAMGLLGIEMPERM